jgi:hypothetical protein
LPGETRSVVIEYPASAGKDGAEVMLRGWNVVPQTVSARR